MPPLLVKISTRSSLHTISLAKALTLLILVICISLVGLTIVFGWKSRVEWLNNARTATENLTFSIAQHAEATLNQTDTVVLDIVERMEREPMSERGLPYLKSVLIDKVTQQPQLHGLFVYDDTGRWMVHSQPTTPVGANNADRDYFQYHRIHPSRAVHVGVPIRSRSTNEWIIPVSRRLNHPDGRFAGVVLATIRLNFFESFHRQFKIGDNGLIAMNLLSGELLTRRPAAADRIGTSLANTALYNDYFARYSNGSVTAHSPLDGHERQYAYRRLARYPIIVISAMPVSDILAGWQHRMIT